ncbi:hypothetical protein G6F65_017213 [Rhizopus arrhizus]|nr:hypothetical protein G6F65_017213 [Rhizopus arrhizus]
MRWWPIASIRPCARSTRCAGIAHPAQHTAAVSGVPQFTAVRSAGPARAGRHGAAPWRAGRGRQYLERRPVLPAAGAGREHLDPGGHQIPGRPFGRNDGGGHRRQRGTGAEDRRDVRRAGPVSGRGRRLSDLAGPAHAGRAAGAPSNECAGRGRIPGAARGRGARLLPGTGARPGPCAVAARLQRRKRPGVVRLRQPGSDGRIALHRCVAVLFHRRVLGRL